MSMVTDLALGTASGAAKKALLPWIIIVCIFVLGSVGAAGMYGGYEIANARFADERSALQQSQVDALHAKSEALGIATARGNEATNIFLTELRAMKIVNTTINNEVRKETEKLIYTDCKLPKSGADLLRKQIDAVNVRLLGGSKK